MSINTVETHMLPLDAKGTKAIKNFIASENARRVKSKVPYGIRYSQYFTSVNAKRDSDKLTVESVHIDPDTRLMTVTVSL